MQQFIPFEDDWDVLESLGPDALIPFHISLSYEHGAQPVTRPQNKGCSTAPASGASYGTVSTNMSLRTVLERG
ncbi:hypothetical protein [Dyella sp. A6]|uniref:hypothetical protein n=1 Tax=Dyella aluminiiresistens TaxID=3069105 RepID=UPI002E7640AC|nr:hypothetical protein [Dyella sp. A6]